MSKAAAKKATGPRVFVPLTKVDEEQRLVYGRITAEEQDQSGEVMDYDTSKPNFEKWSNDIHEASGGLSKGNLRVMHGLSVAGKLTELEFNDNDKSIEVCSKVVDDNEWAKVLEGCYTGFSVGGRYGKKWKEKVGDETLTKYTAVPNEVSLVDNPCVKSATFQLVKADGAEEEVEFQLPEDVLEKLKKADGEEEPEAEAAEGEEEEDAEKTVNVETVDTSNAPNSSQRHPGSDQKPPVQKAEYVPTNAEVATKATELAKAANDGSDWMSHIEPAREELLKANKAKADDDEGKNAEDKGEGDEDKEAAADKPKSKGKPKDKVAKADHAIADRLSQKWTCTDGTAFEKKADAEAHEAELIKAAVEPTEADKLKARLEKALVDPEEEQTELPLEDQLEKMASAVNAISTPFGEDGEPVLAKGMYTVNRFSNVLSDMASVARSIKCEGKKEGDDKTDSAVSADLLSAVQTLGKSFIDYASNQVTELLAGLDDDVVVSYHDYYYNAVQNDPDNDLAKDVVGLISEFRDSATERREELIKGFGIVLGTNEETDEEMSPPLQKRFDALEAENADLRKVATDAIEAVEKLNKRVDQLADEPLQRAPGHLVALREGDNFFGKTANTVEEKTAVLKDMLETHGPDALATMMIKAAHNGGGQRLIAGR